MTFQIHPSTNPHTSGKGVCFFIKTETTANISGDRAASVMFDGYDVKPGITVYMSPATKLTEVEDTDEGCYLTFVNAGAEVTLILPMSIATFKNSIALNEEADRTP